MHDALVPVFGDSGAVIAQYVITLVVILALMALVILGVRRFGRNRIGPTARGRLPRLAIVDALAIDNKRRLVLVRRDNVEHLVLIGGPSDLVVEPSIIRQRVAQRPGQTVGSRIAPGTAQAAPQPPPPPPPAAQAGPPPPPASARMAASRAIQPDPFGAENPIPFPPRRVPIRPPMPPRRAANGPSAPAQPPKPPVRPEPPPPAAEPEIPDELPPEVLAARLRPPPVRPIDNDEPPPDHEPPAVEPTAPPERPPSAFAPPRATRIDPADAAAPEPPVEAADQSSAPAAAAAEPMEGGKRGDVSALEQEMARLLGEISTNRTA